MTFQSHEHLFLYHPDEIHELGCENAKKTLQFVGLFFHFWNIARGLHDFKKIQKNILLNLVFTVLDHTDYCLFDVIYICTFSLKKWR